MKSIPPVVVFVYLIGAWTVGTWAGNLYALCLALYDRFMALCADARAIRLEVEEKGTATA